MGRAVVLVTMTVVAVVRILPLPPPGELPFTGTPYTVVIVAVTVVLLVYAGAGGGGVIVAMYVEVCPVVFIVTVTVIGPAVAPAVPLPCVPFPTVTVIAGSVTVEIFVYIDVAIVLPLLITGTANVCVEIAVVAFTVTICGPVLFEVEDDDFVVGERVSKTIEELEFHQGGSIQGFFVVVVWFVGRIPVGPVDNGGERVVEEVMLLWIALEVVLVGVTVVLEAFFVPVKFPPGVVIAAGGVRVLFTHWGGIALVVSFPGLPGVPVLPHPCGFVVVVVEFRGSWEETEEVMLAHIG